MDTPMPSLLLAVIGKSLLNWAVVLAQRAHMGQSFLGVFCVSLAAVDTLICLALCAVFLLGDLCFLGLRLTRYHVCLLVQIACFTYGLLHWPVFLLAGLDYAWTFPPRLVPTGWARGLAYSTGVCVVWVSALLCVFSSSGPYPSLEGGSHLLLRQCRVFSSPQSAQVGVALLVTVGVALLLCCPEFPPYTNAPVVPDQGGSARGRCQHTGRRRLYWTLVSFFSTWHAFLILLVALLLLQVEIPGYLDMNVPWLCFLNSFLIGSVSWWRSPEYHWQNDLAFPDGFCQWSDFGLLSMDTNDGSTQGSMSSPELCHSSQAPDPPIRHYSHKQCC